MTEEMEELGRRLVIRRKADGRAVYDEDAKAELVSRCVAPGASVSRIARECGVNANQVGRWIRERNEGRRRRVAVSAEPAMRSAFVPVEVAVESLDAVRPEPMLQARLPNGVVIDLRGAEAVQVGAFIEALGRLRCSASTRD